MYRNILQALIIDLSMLNKLVAFAKCGWKPLEGQIQDGYHLIFKLGLLSVIDPLLNITSL